MTLEENLIDIFMNDNDNEWDEKIYHDVNPLEGITGVRINPSSAKSLDEVESFVVCVDVTGTSEYTFTRKKS